MSEKITAGLLMFRWNQGRELYEFFIALPGGPLYANRDIGDWTIPKGQADGDEEPFQTAVREFQEETGFKVDHPFSHFFKLTPIKQRSGRTLHIFAFNATCDEKLLKSNHFSMEWPKGSGNIQQFPEISRGGWFSEEEVRIKLKDQQVGCIDQMARILGTKYLKD